MKKLLIALLIVQGAGLGYAQSTSNARETRATFSPSVDRASPFEFSEKLPDKAPEVQANEGAVGVAEALKRFIVPTGYISGRTFSENKIYFGGRFYEIDDILELEITEGPEQYLYPKMELVIRDINDDGLEIYHQESATLQKISFSFQPDISPKSGGTNSVPGANIIYIGKDQAPSF